MKLLAILVAVGVALSAFPSATLSYEGGTKLVALMSRGDRSEPLFSPVALVPGHQMRPAKPVLALMHRMPEPTLSAERIRGEKQRVGAATKPAMRFFAERRR